MTHTKVLEIANKDINFEKLLNEIELSTGIKLMAKTPDDSVDGFANYIQSADGTSLLEIFTYDNAEIPNKEHKSTLRKKNCTALEKTNIQAVIAAHTK